MRLLALPLLLAAAALNAQGTEPAAKLQISAASPDQAFAKLRGITFFYIDVTTSESRPEDADLRAEIRDAVELEMRRTNFLPKDFNGQSPETATPLLTIEVRFDRGLGRYNADVILSVRDNATITRNKESVLAQTYAQSKKATGSSDTTLAREAKARSRELVVELIEGIRRLKGN